MSIAEDYKEWISPGLVRAHPEQTPELNWAHDRNMIPMWTTEVGSRMWCMHDLASDYDWVNIYRFNTTRLLEGRPGPSTLPQKQYVTSTGREMDQTYMEVGHLVSLLLKGNVNAVWSVMSNAIVYDDGAIEARNHYVQSEFEELRDLVRENLSTSMYNSINGMALSQATDAVKRADVRDPGKSLRTAMRTLLFGIRIFEENELYFTPVMDVPTADHLDETRRRLMASANHSKLPNHVDEEPFRDWLYNVRISDL